MSGPESRVWRENDTFLFEGPLVLSSSTNLFHQAKELLSGFHGKTLVLDLTRVTRIDTAGVALIEHILHRTEKRNVGCRVEGAPSRVAKALKIFSLGGRIAAGERRERKPFFEGVGERILDHVERLRYFSLLLSDTAVYAVTGLVKRKGMRKGEFINQCMLIGMNALPIIALISFLIGFILALQSAAQLRQFGASIYVADLVAISMTREMGPIMTAVILAGRSGSAIASEIATMVVTEETDALKSMALNPLKYVLVPKVYAITLTAPMLTIISIVVGISGALLIGVTYLDISLVPFFNETIQALVFRDIVTGLVKSLVFAWIIVITGAYYGFRVKGGAEGVGRVTTASVVASIFYVVLADSILGLIFYFGQGLEF
jgi:phospholipid/cholesterol/gamma-HCH transport system permease protein